jgi:hypothetical protein
VFEGLAAEGTRSTTPSSDWFAAAGVHALWHSLNLDPPIGRV